MEKYLSISKLFKWKFKATLATKLYKMFIFIKLLYYHPDLIIIKSLKVSK